MKEHGNNANSLGIDEELISTLVDTFYTRIQKDLELGPIFADAIGDGWEPHLERMKVFWGAVALRTGLYSGNPPAVHQRVGGIKLENFDQWLNLWAETLDEIGVSAEVNRFFVERANMIANSLRLSLFGFRGEVGRKLRVI